MGRSVVRNPGPKCERCRLPPRFCICREHREIVSPLDVHVLMHPQEATRPSSTGLLIKRLIPNAAMHVFRRSPPTERGEMSAATQNRPPLATSK